VNPFLFHQAGVSPLEIWYPQSSHSGAVGTAVPTVNTLICSPFFGTTGILDRIQFEVTTLAAGGVARAGIYRATSRKNIYPDNLIVDGGEQSTASTGFKTSTISTQIYDSQLYWFCYLAGTLSATVRVTSIVYPGMFGCNFNVFTGASLAFSFAYAALPATFPAGGAPGTATPPCMSVRYES
jgi:hypothetical protein